MFRSKSSTEETLDEKNEIYVTILGSHESGKTSLIHRFIFGNVFSDKPRQTFEEEIYKHTFDLEKHGKFNFVFRDSGKNPKVQTQMEWISSDGFILVYDITSKKSLEDLTEIVKNIKKQKDLKLMEHDPECPAFPCIIVGCKVDATEKKEVLSTEGKTFANKLLFEENKPSTYVDMPFFLEISSKDGKIHELTFRIYGQRSF